ncbi:MAG TPA: hypothetical protein IAC28_04270 [Candidatus Aphodovivens excrementavium]|nr:hypothetical protein [Candidatus Aphodovivens excrementavium]
MLSMIRSELFRIVRSRFFVVYVVLVCLVSVVAPFALWLYRVWPAFAATGFVDMPAEPLPSLQLYGMTSVSGAFIAMGAGIAMALFVSEDFKSGFVKNLVQVRGGRLSYAVAAVVCSVFLAVVATALGIMVVELTLRAQGYVSAAVSPVDVLQWFTQVALIESAYAMIAALIALSFGSETLATVCAVFFGGGVAESVARLVLANIPGVPAALRDCLDGYLAVDLEMLGQGQVCDPMTYVQAGVTILVAGGLAALVMRHRALA